MRGRIGPDGWAVMAIAAAVVLANLPYLLGFFDPNPLHYRSGLTSSIVHGLLAGKPTIDPNIGFTSQAIGHLAALDLLHLHLPWWNPYEATGMPLLGETQGAALFPFTLLTAMSGGQLYEHMLLEGLGGVCTYFLLRRVVTARAAALAGGIAFALNGTFAWFAHAAVNPVAFLPMLLLGIERAYAAASQGRPSGWRLMAVAGALSLYAGFPEVAYVDALMGLCWFGWRCVSIERARLQPFVVKVVLGGVVGVLLSAPVLLASIGYLNEAFVGVHAGGRLASAHLSAAALPQLLMPYTYGPINADPHAVTWVKVGGYLSTSVLVLAALGLVAQGRRGLRAMLAGWGLLVFARMYGVPLLGRVLGVLPGMSRIEFYRYGTTALELSVIVLAALGVEDLVRVAGHRRRLGWAALGAIVTVASAALYARPKVNALGTGYHHASFFHASIAWAVLAAAAAGATVLARSPRARAGLLTAVLAVDGLALFLVPEFSAPRSTTLDLAPIAYLRAHLGESRFFTLGPIQPNYGSYFALASLSVNDYPPQLFANFVHARADPLAGFVGRGPGPSVEHELLTHLDGYRALAVRYVLTPARSSLPAGQRAFTLVYRSPSTRIYELAGSAPYFSAGGCAVTSTARTSARVTCSHPATLIRRETALSGWSARLDGHPIAIGRVDGLFQTVDVPAGAHEVSFSYAPPGIAWAFLAMLGGVVLTCVEPARRITRPRASRSIARPSRP